MITKALMFSCDNENGNRIERTYGCTFIFTDEIDKGLNKGYTLQSKNVDALFYKNVDALFYENENVKKHFDTVRELYDYCNKLSGKEINNKSNDNNGKYNKYVKEDGAEVAEYDFYAVERHNEKTDTWIGIGDSHYLPEYEFGEMTSSGECWQKTRCFGMLNFEYAKKFCNDLNEALENKTCNKFPSNTDMFRLIHVKKRSDVEVVKPKLRY